VSDDSLEMPTPDGQATRSPALEVSDLTVSLGGRPVLRRVDLRVDRGQFVALLGPNGSGKSTLVRSCVGLVPLVSGSVTLLGTPLAEFGDWRRIGYVPQRPTLTSGVPATVREVVETGRLAMRRPFAPARAADRQAVQEALRRVRLAERATDPVAQLSGGQQQRTMIARALAGEPDLLILDEPTAGVDRESQEVLTGVFAELMDAGAALLLVTHELGPLAALVDRAVEMRDGRVVYDGPPHGAFRGGEEHVHQHTGQPARDDVIRGEGMWR
jgi:zinc transport system ATP-binding protein